jgi:hypothetical protein
MNRRTMLSAKQRRQAAETLRRATNALPQTEVYLYLAQLGDESRLSQNTTHQRVILAGTAFLEIALEAAITKHFHQEISPSETNKLFVGGDGGAGLLATFNARLEIAKALGILSNEAQVHLRTIQLIRNHFAHAKLSFSFDDELVNNFISGCIAIRTLTRNQEKTRQNWTI